MRALAAAMVLAASAPWAARAEPSVAHRAPDEGAEPSVAHRTPDAGAEPSVARRPLAEDPVLRSLLAEAAARRPELAAARAEVRARLELEPQAGALPDPRLSLGMQNGSFTGIDIGRAPMSFLSVGLAQTLPWPGKRRLRAEVAELAARQAEAEQQRARLSVASQVTLAYLELLLVRARLEVLDRQEALWAQAEALARARYEAGDGAQSDLLRAQLERNRLRQVRIGLSAEERQRVLACNRLAGRELDAALPGSASLDQLADPGLPELSHAQAEAEAGSPELRRAELGVAQAGRRLALASKERLPDLTVSAAVLPRWGSFAPMWQAGISFALPLWNERKQARGVAESEARMAVSASAAGAVRNELRQRVAERHAALAALDETNHLYRAGLLVQSQATVASTLVQFQAGRAGFASVLNALDGYLADRNAYLESLAAAQRIAIAERELALGGMP